MYTSTLRRFLNHTAAVLCAGTVAIAAVTATANTSSDPTTTPGSSTNADNTKRNSRDYGTNEVSPFDQGNSEADLKTTQDIRKAVLKQDGLSTYARNVKIITRDGQVVLRGPVRTADEKAVIELAARQIAGEANVRSQLEVKAIEGRPATPDSSTPSSDSMDRPSSQTDRPSTREPAP